MNSALNTQAQIHIKWTPDNRMNEANNYRLSHRTYLTLTVRTNTRQSDKIDEYLIEKESQRK